MKYHTEKILCRNSEKHIFGKAYIPEGNGTHSLVIFSHELGCSHRSGVRYAERLAENGISAYVFDFCGGSAPGTLNRSDGTGLEMSVMTEASDLEAVLRAAGEWEFVDKEKIFLLGGSQGAIVSLIAGTAHRDDIAGLIMMYPPFRAKEDRRFDQYESIDDVPAEIGLFNGWMTVGKKYYSDIWDIDYYKLFAGYKDKILLLHGDADRTVPVSWSEKAAELNPRCEFHVIKGGRHMFYRQPFEDAMGYILSYIKQRSAVKR